MCPRKSSMVIWRGGGGCSTPVEVFSRTLVTPFALVILTWMSSSLWWIPQTMPSYTASAGATQNDPRFFHLTSWYDVALPAAEETMEPASRKRTLSPWNGPYSRNREVITACPFVRRMKTPCIPMRLRVGILKDMIIVSSLGPHSMETISADFFCISSMTTPWYSVGASTTTSSYGSSCSPVAASVCRMTSGAPIMISKPSRLRFSTSTPSCRTPRPFTLKKSLPRPGSTRRATLDIASFSRRVFSWLPVSHRDSGSWPQKGEVFTPNSMATVGSSTTIGGRARDLPAGSTTVSPILTSSIPVNAQMSPASILSALLLPLLWKSQSLLILAVLILPSGPYWNPTSLPLSRLPDVRRPMEIRPMKGS
mmetsp:Transcript_120015/g.325694  ORF Transcript_120015/g.325694 Transcript_120015/m.325694 type:complete len:366 (+) Transcript_120015:190-1287(+)